MYCLCNNILIRHDLLCALRKIKVKAYSTSANLGPGYDILALAHNAFADELVMEIDKIHAGNRIRIIGNNVPPEAKKNSAGLPLIKLFNEFDIRESVTIHITKNIPVGSGLGSSGSSAAASIAAANELFSLSLSRDEMIRFAMEGECASSGTPHADNVAASIYGYVVSVNSVNPPKAYNIKTEMDLKFMSIIPDVHIPEKTKLARSMVPFSITLESGVRNSRNLASLISGFASGKRDLIRDGMDDGIVERSRLSLFPYYTSIKANAMKKNAVGVCVSGAGPTILILYDNETDLHGIEDKIDQIMRSAGITYRRSYSTLSGGMEIE